MAQRATTWLKERWRDVLLWPVNLVRDLPRRVRRLGGAFAAHSAAVHLLPGRTSTTALWIRPHLLLVGVFDLVGGPEIAQYLMHLFMETSSLQPHERAAISSVLGPQAIRYEDVRIAEGGILPAVFRFNGGRAFCTWHTIHLQRHGRYTRDDLGLLVHEATHIYQYEQRGTAYIGEALHAQHRLGRGAYDYGGPAGLEKARRLGSPYAAFNREAQAQIAQDYYMRREAGRDVSAYRPFIAQLRAGRI